MSFEKLLRPRSVAVVGASADPLKVGHSILKHVVEGGFKGGIYPINPKADHLVGKQCYKSLLDVPDEIDLAIIIVKRDLVLGIIDDCITKKIESAIIITAGFSETGEVGKKLQQELIQKVRASRMTVIGPNCLGLINPWVKLNAAFGQALGEPGTIALVSQSGALITAIQDWAAENKIGFSVVASIGNKACVDEVNFLENLRHDPNTKVISAYLEDISQGQEFMRIAEIVSKEKPVVILKSGRTSAGARAASSHTGSLAGADASYNCAFERTGVIRAESIEHLFDVAVAFAYQPLPKGSRIAVVTNAGGPGIMMSDALEMAGLTVAQLKPETEAALAQYMPESGSTHNPVDVLGDAPGDRYAAAIETLLAATEVDGLIVILTPQKMTDDIATAQAMVDLAKKYPTKTMFGCFMGAKTIAGGVDLLRVNKIPQYPIPERAAKAMFEMVKYSNYRARPLRVVERFAVNKNPVIKIFRTYRSRNMFEVGELDAKTIMRAYNFEMPPNALASTVEEAVRFGNELGYPLAMKISSPDILHKSDIGGVKIGLANAGAVQDAYELMMLRISRKMPSAQIRGVLLEKMVSGGKEVILGMKKDPQFGPLIMFGLGGIFVEVLKDVTFSLAPVTAEEAMHMIERTKTYKLLTGARGERGVDIGSIVENLMRISQLCVDFPEIEEIDINPLMVGAEGDGANVVDARIIIAKEIK